MTPRRSYRDYCRPPLQLELTTKRPGDLVLTSSRVLKVERREVRRG
jgi:hypothetical protein